LSNNINFITDDAVNIISILCDATRNLFASNFSRTLHRQIKMSKEYITKQLKSKN